MLTPAQRDLAAYRLQMEQRSSAIILCFAPDTPQEVVSLFSLGEDQALPRYNQTSRWSVTASGSTGGVGDPITLTYSYPPDGTVIPFLAAAGFPEGINDFNDWMNSLYGSPANWQPLFEQMFDRWSQLCGVTYLYEPNDDGVPMHQNAGVLGVRGDLRIGGKFLDGNSGVLAYNNFPNDGDMVFDSFDSFYETTSSNSLRLRNVAAHEHGHGMGQLHVCPANATKLMEPFISTAYDGPRHDDVRNAQRHYGDPFEPNDFIGQTTDLGLIPVGGSVTLGTIPNPTIPTTTLLAIEGDGQSDFFQFTLSQSALVTIVATPVGLDYDDSNQVSGGCQSGNFTNSQNIANLAIWLYDSDATSLLATAAAAPLGSPESIVDVALTAAGTYYVRIFESNTPAESQLYLLQVDVEAIPFIPLTVSVPDGPPSVVAPGAPTEFDVVIVANDEQLVPGSAQLRFRTDAGPFLSAPLASIGGNNYLATLPGVECGQTPQFYVEATGTISGVLTNPPDGASAPFSAIVSTGTDNLVDNFETEQGWVVSGNASDGQWGRGVPINCDRGDPPADSDGSGQCRLTDNSAAQSCNSDVDNGATILTTPPFDLSFGGAVSYDYWLNDIPSGPIGVEDHFRVEVATDVDGANWQIVREYTTAQAAWRSDAIQVGLEVAASATIRLRFSVTDNTPGDVIEAGLDNFRIAVNLCEPGVATPAAPAGLSASDGAFCDRVSLGWNASPGADGYDIFRHTVNDPDAAVALATGVAATAFDDLTSDAGATYFYWVKACNSGGCSAFSTADTGSRASAPGVVADIAASDASCGVIQITWSAVPGAATYEVRRSLTGVFNDAVSLGTTALLQFDDATAVADSTYQYWVAASNACGQGAFGGPEAGLAVAVLPAPGGLTASQDECGLVALSWSAVAGASGYQVRRNHVEDFLSADLLASPAVPSFHDATALPDMPYFYWVAAVNDCGAGAAAGPQQGIAVASPDAPDNVIASDDQCGVVNISWSSVPGTTSYTILRNTINDTSEALNLGTTSTTTFADDTAALGITYFYWVSAANVCGGSSRGGPDTGGTINLRPPTGITATDAGCGPIQVTWNAQGAAVSYDVFRSTLPDVQTAALVGNTGGSSFSDQAVEAGQTYFYWVSANNVCGASAKGGPDSGLSAGFAPAAPAGVSASDDAYCGYVIVEWSPVSGAASYSVFRNVDPDPQTAELLQNTTGLSVQDSSGLAGQLYHYWVTATNDCGASDFSEPDPGLRNSGTPGDLNGDTQVNGADIQGFADAVLVDPFFDPCADLAAPFGVLDAADTLAFVALLASL